MGDEYDDNVPTTGDEYARYILNEWLEVSAISKLVRKDLLLEKSNTLNSENIYNLVVMLTSLWGQLKPKVMGRQFKTAKLEETYNTFEKYNLNPKLLIDIQAKDAKGEEIFKLEAILRQVIEELKITEWTN